MKLEGNLGKALALPAVTLAAVFAPHTLLYAAGMYVAGSIAGAYTEAAFANAANRIRKDYEGSEEAAALCEGLGHLGNGAIRLASMACPVTPLVAAAVGHSINKRTFPKKPRLNREPMMNLTM